MSASVDHLGLQARLQPTRLAAVDLASGRRWTYAALDLAVGRCVRLLTDYGCRPGDRVASLARNSVDLAVLHLACARAGLIYVPLNWRLSPAEIRDLVEDAEPRLVFGDAELARAGVVGAPIAELAEALEQGQPLATNPIDRGRPSLILYTSGTSGRPKGVLLSERNLDQTAINFGRLGRVTHDSVFLNDAPMFHIIGLITTIRPPLLHGGAFLVSDGFDPARTLRRMEDPALAVSHYFCVPQMAAALRAQPSFAPERLGGLTAIFTGGAPHPAADIRAWLDDGVPIVDGFGMSEAGTVFGMPVDRDAIAARAGSAGVAMPGVASRIVDAEGAACEPGQPGELLLKGENVFSAYWRRPAETRAAFNEGGWFHTGDIAVCDEDGFHWLIDRKKDMFISGGENVYPAEIEAALADHPHIAECAVVGMPDARWGEVGCLVVVARPGALVVHAEIIAHLEPRLARYKLPKETCVVTALPRTGTGKIQKGLLKAMLRERAAS
ncbi:AMP-binding protein [Caulobacter segnis]|uniref:AMP-binding protein n=1 Tax=Caulobacter segnis TaxID=88688 RepID=UPI001CBEFC17|nr:AMP-binding protein [Caulobacter segnis]UAL09278.1 AMP-binding protein [Caulobacter segnis]